MRNIAYAVLGVVTGGLAVYLGYQAYRYYVVRKTLEETKPVKSEDKKLNLKNEGKMGKTVETTGKQGLKFDEVKSYVIKKFEEGENLYEISKETGLPPIVMKDWITPKYVKNGQKAKIIASPDIPILVGGDKVTSKPIENPKVIEGGGASAKTSFKGFFF